jgi:hypothetical protein
MTANEALYDDLAGIVDLFGALSRAELGRALDELAFKQGRDADAEALADAVDGAVRNYYLVAVADDGTGAGGSADADAADGADLLVVGPVAFPSLPANAEDLPHILDVPERSVDREAVVAATVARLRAEAEALADDVAEGGPAPAEADDPSTEADDPSTETDRDRARRLLDATYDAEAWAGSASEAASQDLEEVRSTLDSVLD